MSARQLTPNCGTCVGLGWAAREGLCWLLLGWPQKRSWKPISRETGGVSGAQVATGLLGTAFPSHPSRSCSELGDVPCGCQRWSPPHHGVESHQAALLLGPPADLDFAYGEHPRREAVTAELWAPAHPELLYISLPSRGTRPFLSLRSLWLRAPLLPATEKPCRPITLSNRLSPPLAREQLLE